MTFFSHCFRSPWTAAYFWRRRSSLTSDQSTKLILNVVSLIKLVGYGVIYCTVIPDSIAKRITICFDVPQGSHFAPILFAVLINNIWDNLMSNCLLFAEDLKMFRSIRSSIAVEILQKDLTSLVNWRKQNDIQLNIGKCKSIIFSEKNKPYHPYYNIYTTKLESVSIMRGLGTI